MARRGRSAALIGVGVACVLVGYARPGFLGQGARPYAYLSVMAIGAMFVIFGAMLWRDS